MDRAEGVQACIKFRVLRNFQNKKFHPSYSQTHSYPFVYVFEGDTVLSKHYSFKRTEIGWSFRFGFHEKYIRSFNQNISLGTKFLYVWLRLAHGSEILGGTFTYTKLDDRISKTFLIKRLGKLGFQIDAGTIQGNVPFYTIAPWPRNESYGFCNIHPRCI